MYLSNSQALTHLSEVSKIILNVTNKDIHSILPKRDINPPVQSHCMVSSQGNSASQTESTRLVNSLSYKLRTMLRGLIVMMMALETPDG